MPSVSLIVEHLDSLLDPTAYDDYGPNGLQVPGRDAVQTVVTAVSANVATFTRAREEGADLVLVSPVFATRSHPKARPLGPVRLGLMLDGRLPAIALGGMSAKNFLRLNGLDLYGWAGIDAFRT